MATWMELNPEYDVPYMPTEPEHQSWSASHAITAQRSRCSCGGYSSSATPSEDPVPRTSTRQTTYPPSSRRRAYSGR